MDVDLSFLPSEIKRILLDFTLSCLMENPNDFVIFGCEYFEKLLKRRADNLRRMESAKLKESRRMPGIDLTRRQSIIGNVYDPENDILSTDDLSVVFKTEEERLKLSSAIKDIFLFRNLNSSDTEVLINVMKERIVEAGEIIIEQGLSQSDSFYIVKEGCFEAIITSKSGVSSTVKSYVDKGSFGELALMYNTPRAATVRAVTDGKLWVLDRYSFNRIVLKRAFLKRKRYHSLIDNVELLSNLTYYEKLDLADALVPKVFSDGEIIFNEGDEGDGMYFIESGRVMCSKTTHDQKSLDVKELERGQYFGELALLTDKARALTARSVGATEVAFLDKDTFQRLLGSLVEVLNRNVKQYEEVMNKIGESPSNIITSDHK